MFLFIIRLARNISNIYAKYYKTHRRRFIDEHWKIQILYTKDQLFKYCQRAECKFCIINKYKQLVWESSKQYI